MHTARSISCDSRGEGLRETQQYISRDPRSSPVSAQMTTEKKLYRPKSAALCESSKALHEFSSGMEIRETVFPISQSRALQISFRIFETGARAEIDSRMCSSVFSEY